MGGRHQLSIRRCINRFLRCVFTCNKTLRTNQTRRALQTICNKTFSGGALNDLQQNILRGAFRLFAVFAAFPPVISVSVFVDKDASDITIAAGAFLIIEALAGNKKRKGRKMWARRLF